MASPALREWVLGIDISAAEGEVALLDRGGSESRVVPLDPSVRGARALLPALAHLLEMGGADREAIAGVGVALGPGAFTGLRVGLATAKGLALGLERPLYGFSSLEAMALSAWDLWEATEERTPPAWVLPYRDARHGEVFWALFGPAAPDGEFLRPLRARDDQVARPEEIPIPAKGALLLAGTREDLPAPWRREVLGPRARHFEMKAAAGAVARLAREALERGEPPAPADLEPRYGRKPRAQTQWAVPEG